MIGKPEWFERRKYLGWGIHPKTKEGWIYLLFIILIAIIIQFLPLNTNLKFLITIGYIVLLILDVLHIMTKLKKDERERIHEAIEDRNALWIIIFVLIIAIFYQSVVAFINKTTYDLDIWIIIALLSGALMKTFTGIYLRKKS